MLNANLTQNRDKIETRYLNHYTQVTRQIHINNDITIYINNY
jgi:predicted ABC-type ATPase